MNIMCYGTCTCVKTVNTGVVHKLCTVPGTVILNQVPGCLGRAGCSQVPGTAAANPQVEGIPVTFFRLETSLLHCTAERAEAETRHWRLFWATIDTVELSMSTTQ